jgi:hypothetical protein
MTKTKKSAICSQKEETMPAKAKSRKSVKTTMTKCSARTVNRPKQTDIQNKEMSPLPTKPMKKMTNPVCPFITSYGKLLIKARIADYDKALLLVGKLIQDNYIVLKKPQHLSPLAFLELESMLAVMRKEQQYWLKSFITEQVKQEEVVPVNVANE